MIRGQTSLFMIIGALLILASGTVYLSSEAFDPPLERSVIEPDDKTSQLIRYVESCLEQTTDLGIRYLALQGGYYSVQENYEDVYNVRVPYYFQSWEPITKQQAANELELFLDNNLPVCIDDFSAFTQFGMTVDAGSPTFSVVIVNESTSVHLLYEVTLIHTAGVVSEQAFETTVELPYGLLIDVMRQGTSVQEEAYPYWEMTAFLDPAVNLGLNYSQLYHSPQHISHLLTAPLPGRDLTFAFATQQPWPIIFGPFEFFEEIPVLVSHDDEPIDYQIEFLYDDVSLFHDSDRVSVTQDGRIYYDVYEADETFHSFTLTATRPNGERRTQEIFIQIGGSSSYVDMLEIPVINISVGERFVYQVQMSADSDSSVLFSDDTDLFEIHPTEGLISFTLTEPINETIKITAATATDSDDEYIEVVVS